MNTHSTDLKREHTQADARPEKPKITPKTFCKPALHGLLTTSMNAKDHRNAKLGLESPIAGNISALNAPGSTTHSNGNNIVVSRSLLRSTNVSDTVKGTPKDDNRPIFELKRSRIIKVDTISPKPDLPLEKELMEVSGKKGFHVATSRIANSYAEEKPALRSPSKMQKIPKESVSDQKGPTVLKRIVASSPARKSPKTVSELGNKTIPRSGIPKARMDNAISSAISCEMGEISELELPALLENDGNVEKAEACRKELEDICISLKRKHAEAKELAVRAIVNNNMMLMLNHPMFEEKICALQKFAKSLRSKKFLFEDISAMDAEAILYGAV